MQPRLLVLCGPTGSGKTALSIQLAQQLGCNILCADSRQIYREMETGTAKPTVLEQAQVPHWGLDLVLPAEAYSAARYAEYAQACLTQLFATQQPTQILCGGTGLYIQAVCEGLDEIPPTLPETRSLLGQRLAAEGLDSLVAELKRVDAATWQRIDLRNPRRVQRALEVYYDTGRPLSAWQAGGPRPRAFSVQYYALDWPRAVLYARIDQRVDEMMAAGLVAETEQLLDRYGPQAPGLQAIGYAETVAYLQGAYDIATLTDQIKQHTRNYAKRQLSWFRRLAGLQWLAPHQALQQLCASI
ncbi:MAG: tRNA (adenosine(37)-N6)-dimethylallyltransferase MiaA [Bacteroidetes bacterium]|jgi:tRNA dimethylallyltransferase|nr:tRNA (adenosine(37)-N6)-dimethylallyltransferase MiaA [Bacteroidota bacterium]